MKLRPSSSKASQRSDGVSAAGDADKSACRQQVLSSEADREQAMADLAGYAAARGQDETGQKLNQYRAVVKTSVVQWRNSRDLDAFGG